MSDVAERVQRGVDRLDRHRVDWADLIDPTELDMRHVHNCVLGQIFGSYFRGVDYLFGRGEQDQFDAAIDHGFNVEAYGGQEYEDEYDGLNAGWRECVIDRRLADNEAFVAEHFVIVTIPRSLI